MKPIPRVSVVIPHLNDNEELKRCLARLDAQVQETPAFEVIVADNGSVALPEAVSKRAVSTRIVVERHPGPGPARSSVRTAGRGLHPRSWLRLSNVSSRPARP
ncbi:MAG: glycosyltransferase, partial [Devosia nanyangense]|nr:glycosyltransferase [Devosia nanyangense]